MSKLITAPDTETLTKLFNEGLTCRVSYGTEVCGKPAQWKIIMSCCGASDFMCSECYQDAKASDAPNLKIALQNTEARKLLGDPLYDPEGGYFGCSHCHHIHPTFAAAVREAVKI